MKRLSLFSECLLLVSDVVVVVVLVLVVVVGAAVVVVMGHVLICHQLMTRHCLCVLAKRLKTYLMGLGARDVELNNLVIVIIIIFCSGTSFPGS